MSAHCRVYQDENGEWRFRFKAANGENVGPASQGFRDASDAERGAYDLAKTVREAHTVETPGNPILDIRREVGE